MIPRVLGIALLFAAIYKLLPDTRVDWIDVWTGGFITAVLFTIGKFAIGAYLASTDVATRERATLVLGFIGGEEALVLLERARGDGDLRVVRAAERAIARLRRG